MEDAERVGGEVGFGVLGNEVVQENAVPVAVYDGAGV